MSGFESLRREIIKCKDCPVRLECTTPVPFIGNPEARVMIVARNPGKVEDEKGEPLVGPGGRFLDHFLNAAKLSRSELMLHNILACYTTIPKPDRAPVNEEITVCIPRLYKLIDMVGPEYIVALGKQAVYWMVGVDVFNADKHGSLYAYRNPDYDIKVFAINHPGYLVRRHDEKEYEEDGRKFRSLLDGSFESFGAFKLIKE